MITMTTAQRNLSFDRISFGHVAPGDLALYAIDGEFYAEVDRVLDGLGVCPHQDCTPIRFVRNGGTWVEHSTQHYIFVRPPRGVA